MPTANYSCNNQKDGYKCMHPYFKVRDRVRDGKLSQVLTCASCHKDYTLEELRAAQAGKLHCGGNGDFTRAEVNADALPLQPETRPGYRSGR